MTTSIQNYQHFPLNLVVSRRAYSHVKIDEITACIARHLLDKVSPHTTTLYEPALGFIVRSVTKTTSGDTLEVVSSAWSTKPWYVVQLAGEHCVQEVLADQAMATKDALPRWPLFWLAVHSPAFFVPDL